MRSLSLYIKNAIVPNSTSDNAIAPNSTSLNAIALTLHQKCDRSHSTPEMRSLSLYIRNAIALTLHQKCDRCLLYIRNAIALTLHQ
ncbi:MAG: hypothetical protein HEQ29_17495 [Dolichospermum sp. LBC05a]|nr:hypothetical protein [Dolichospermum sp. OL01]MCO5798472.1 hypothetical protein [Dolichospermum sp. OL03]MCS6279179.1 hypothetical protein [Dolichospermum sp.]QSV59908.1 MAG: hypothetical protein HEQ29_17495 [Dolichospermum sp. LBC05a]